ncbi:MAG: glycosyltransferase family 9 protein [Candidatus Omnitrophica bacterium]|nr:glycosyltransferase family 9 protein [Candidatus Omnitrophota bacterium]
MIFSSNQIRKILVISLTNLGDVILTAPVLATLKKHFPGASLSVVIGPKAAGLLQGSRTVDHVMIYDKRKMSLFQKLRWVGELRREKFDLVVDLRNTLIPYLIGARYHFNSFAIKKPLSMRERHLSHLSGLRLPNFEASFDFFSEKDVQQYQEKLIRESVVLESGFLVIAPGAGSYLKRWPIDRFQEVARHFARSGKQVMIVGSEAEKDLGAQIKQSVPVVDMCGLFTLRELAALLKDAELVLSCDSAIMHLANEQNAPVVSIFGPTDEKKYAKFGAKNRVIRVSLPCTPCERAHCKFKREHCMEDLSVEQVIQSCEELLYVSTH